MVQRWLCISNRSNDIIARQALTWGVSKRYKNSISQVKKGDTLLIYTVREDTKKEIIPPKITSIFKVVSDVFEDTKPLFTMPKGKINEIFPYRIKLEPILDKYPIQFIPLVPILSFIKNKQMWTGSIRRAIIKIPENDYKLIIKGMQHG